MNETKQPKFIFKKKLGIAECMYGNISFMQDMIARLLFCMKETNNIHGTSCEFFRLDFRPPTYEELSQEFPNGSLVLDLKFGSKEELEKVDIKK